MDITIILVIIFGILIVSVLGYFIYYMVTKNYCKATTNAGGTCLQGCDCATGTCALISPTSSTVCCPSGETITASDGLLYCAGYPNGSICNDNRMCTSGSCVGGKCIGSAPPAPPPPAPPPPAPPQSCTEDTNCPLIGGPNGPRACGYYGTNATQTTCCPSGETDWFWFKYYCTGTPSGTPCYSGAMCASGNCTNGVCQ